MKRNLTIMALFLAIYLLSSGAVLRAESMQQVTPSVDVVATGLDTPWALAFAPDGRIFVTERAGRIRIVKDGALQPEPWMTLQVAEVSEAGLLGLAIDPNFAENRYVYVAYTYRSGGGLANRLARLREDPATGKGVADKVLIDNVPGANNHDGGRVKFGPDGKLYWTMGDAQNMASAQNRGSLNGKILRLNPDGSVPTDNPFPNSYVYSFGHRNPQGLAWQPGTGRLYETEHGPSGEKGCCRDEVNFIEAGKNYGWPTATGSDTQPGMFPAHYSQRRQRNLGTRRHGVRQRWPLGRLTPLRRATRICAHSYHARSGQSA
jgi:glucose/arabinose dehydrogenase